MNPSDLERDLAQGTFKPLYLFYGQETILMERALSRIAGFVPEGMRDFNFQTFLADETPAPEIVEQARTMPFMTPPRVVVVRGVDHYKTEDTAFFLKYLENPNESTCLVLAGEKPDLRLKFFKTVREKGLDVAFETPKGRGLVVWVKEAMSRRGQKIDDDAARALLEQVGTDLMELDREVEKISLYALERTRIGTEDVRAAARTGQTANVFMLGDAVGEQNPGKALEAVKELLETDHHLPILAMLVRHFRLLLKAKILIMSGEHHSQAARALAVPPFVARKYMDQAEALSLRQIKKGLACLLEANLTLISSPAPARLVMDRLVLELASLKQR